jgi:hypothetical protein
LYPRWKMTHTLQNIVFYKWSVHGFFLLIEIVAHL